MTAPPTALRTALDELIAAPHSGAGALPHPATVAAAVGDILRGGAPSAQVAAFLMGLRCAGERTDLLVAVAETLLAHATPLPAKPLLCVDTCGTGGDGQGTVNISTGVAMLCAAMGLRVAKHGNRALTSRSGSADVLEALGIPIRLSPQSSATLLRETGFCFLFAPDYHPAMKHAAPVRRELGFRSIFNLAGPLSNPARPTHQIVGVSEPALTRPIAEALRALGRKRALVVHSQDGHDEISTGAETHGFHLRDDGTIEPFFVDPAALGIVAPPPSALQAGGPEDSAAALKSVLQGVPGPVSDAIAINAAAVLWMTGQAESIAAAFKLAGDFLHSEAAGEWLLDFTGRAHSIETDAT